MKALITGGAGGVGLHLARRLLSDGARVALLDVIPKHDLDRDAHELLASPAAEYLEGDLTHLDFALGADYTHIFHLAAILGVREVMEAPLEVLEKNAEATFVALELAARQNRLERFIFASTSEVYAGSLEVGGLAIPTPETNTLALPDLGRPRTSYMLSKLYGEAAVRLSGLPATIVRPHNFFGPRMGSRHVIPQMLSRAHNAVDGDHFEVYSPDHTRCFCYIIDAVEMIFRLSTSPNALGATVNVGTQEPEIRMDVLARSIGKVVGRKLDFVPMPPTEGSPVRRAPDMSYCAELCNYRSDTPLEYALHETYRWYRANVFEA